MKHAFIAILIINAVSGLWANQTLINLPADTWYEVPNTHMIDVMRTDMGDRENLINAWSGGVYDPVGRRLLVWGGGMGNYRGNEFYAFYIDSLKWVRLNEPCLNPGCCDPDPCGTAMVRHTYGGMAFITHANRFFVNGGAKNCGSQSCPDGRTGEGIDLKQTWTFNMADKTWEQKNASGAGYYMQTCAYNPGDKKVYYACNGGTFTYAYDTDTWTQISSARSTGSQGSLIDPVRKWFVRLGSDGNVWDHEVCTHDLTSPGYTKTNYMTTGSNNIIDAAAPGVEYDPVADKYVCWKTGNVCSLDPDTWEWSSHSGSGAPPTTSNGVYGRWRYVPHVNAYICVTGASINVHFYKFTAGGAAGAETDKGTKGGGLEVRVEPNPFYSAVVIRLANGVGANNYLPLPQLAIYDTHGRMVHRVRRFNNGHLTWSASGLSTGIYLVQVRAGDRTAVKKVILAK